MLPSLIFTYYCSYHYSTTVMHNNMRLYSVQWWGSADNPVLLQTALMHPININGSDLIQAACVVLKEFTCRKWYFQSLFSPVSLNRPWNQPHLLHPKRLKKPETNELWTVRAFLQNLAYMYIASLRFYRQMYNKYIINRLLLWDSDEPALRGGLLFVFFSSCFSRVAVRRGVSRDLPLTRSTRTPLRSGGRSPSTPSSPCLLSGGWRSVRRLCCSPWSSCAQNLGGHGEVEVMEESGWRGDRAGGEWAGLETPQPEEACLKGSDCGRMRL